METIEPLFTCEQDVRTLGQRIGGFFLGLRGKKNSRLVRIEIYGEATDPRLSREFLLKLFALNTPRLIVLVKNAVQKSTSNNGIDLAHVLNALVAGFPSAINLMGHMKHHFSSLEFIASHGISVEDECFHVTIEKEDGVVTTKKERKSSSMIEWTIERSKITFP